MKNTFLAFIGLFILAGCAETNQQDKSAITGSRNYKGFPVKVVTKTEGLPVEIKAKAGERVPVELWLGGEGAMPVTMVIDKNTKTALLIAAAIALSILCAVIFAVVIACVAYENAKYAEKTAKAIKNSRKEQKV